jgi:hypothetical protein
MQPVNEVERVDFKCIQTEFAVYEYNMNKRLGVRL